MNSESPRPVTAREVAATLSGAPIEEARQLIKRYAEDPRAQVRRAVEVARRRVEREESERRNRFETLTPREKDVVHAVLEGKANKVIARDLGLEVSTVKMHRANAFAKLGVHSPAELTRLAFESGYADAKTTLS